MSVTPAEQLAVAPAPGNARQSPGRTALAGLIGNVLEWFDFAVYGYFIGDIGRQFFPRSDATAQQLLAFAVFALGFVARPIGSLVLGRVGDRIGRRALLTLSIALMGGATLVIGLLPTYEQIGVAAPLLLVAMRLVQGFSVGGEFTGSMVYTTESASPLMRGLISSSTAAGVTIGFMLGSGSAWLVNTLLRPEQVASWGWRVPFIASISLCVLGWFLRRGIHETVEGLKAAGARPPLLPSIAADWRPMLQTFGIVATTNAAYYLSFTYMVERRKALAGGGVDFLLATTVALVGVLISKPLGGWLSDYTRPPPADDDPHGGHDGAHRAGIPADAPWDAHPIPRRTDSDGRAAGHGAGPSGSDAGGDLSPAQSRDVHEHRLQRDAGARRRNGAARVGVAHRQARRAARSRLLHPRCTASSVSR